MIKLCNRCKIEKKIESFKVQRMGKKGKPIYESKCSNCITSYRRELRSKKFGDLLSYSRWQHLRCRYNITVEEYNKMIKQGCNICGSYTRLHVDHCHESEKIRGILCSKCNLAIGLFRNKPLFLRNAAMYLENVNDNHG